MEYIQLRNAHSSYAISKKNFFFVEFSIYLFNHLMYTISSLSLACCLVNYCINIEKFIHKCTNFNQINVYFKCLDFFCVQVMTSIK